MTVSIVDAENIEDVNRKKVVDTMKVIMPVNEDQKTVCIVFGRTPLFLIYDSVTDKVEFKENPAKDAEGGAGVRAAQFVLDEGADAVITVRLGKNSAEVFQTAGIEIWKADGSDAEDILKLFSEHKLEKLTNFHGGYHGIR